HQMQRPVERRRQFVVVVWVTLSQEAEEVLVDKVKPEKSVTTLAASVSQARENMPRSRDQQEESKPGKHSELAPPTPLARNQQVAEGRDAGEQERDEPLRENSERHACISGIPSPRLRSKLQRGQKEIERSRDQRAQEHVGNQNPAK